MSQNHRRLNQRRWQGARRAVLERDGYRCTNTDCGKAGKLEVHHVTALYESPELAYALDNLKTLCRNCHLEHAVFGPRLEWLHYLKTKFQEINQ